MSPTIGRRRLLLLMAGTSLGLMACSSQAPAAPTTAPAKPTEAAAAAKPTDAPKPAGAASPASSPAASPGASPGASPSPAASASGIQIEKPAAGTVPGGSFTIASLGPLPKTAHPY